VRLALSSPESAGSASARSASCPSRWYSSTASRLCPHSSASSARLSVPDMLSLRMLRGAGGERGGSCARTHRRTARSFTSAIRLLACAHQPGASLERWRRFVDRVLRRPGSSQRGPRRASCWLTRRQTSVERARRDGGAARADPLAEEGERTARAGTSALVSAALSAVFTAIGRRTAAQENGGLRTQLQRMEHRMRQKDKQMQTLVSGASKQACCCGRARRRARVCSQ
jgi:hypothetical protein